MGKRELSKDYEGERRSKGISLAEGDNFVRIVRDAYGKAVVHWTVNAEGNNVRLCCPGEYRKKGLRPDVCPACAHIRDEQEAGVKPDDQRCKWQRKFYLAAVTVTFIKKKRWKKKDGKKVPIMKDGKQATKRVPIYGERIELLGGRDGVGPQIFESLADIAADESYGDPTNWIVNIKKTGAMRATRYTVQPIPPSDSGKLPDLTDFSDPMDLLGDGLGLYEDTTPLAEIYLALGIAEGLEVDESAFGEGESGPGDTEEDEVEEEDEAEEDEEEEEEEDDDAEEEEVEDDDEEEDEEEAAEEEEDEEAGDAADDDEEEEVEDGDNF